MTARTRSLVGRIAALVLVAACSSPSAEKVADVRGPTTPPTPAPAAGLDATPATTSPPRPPTTPEQIGRASPASPPPTTMPVTTTAAITMPATTASTPLVPGPATLPPTTAAPAGSLRALDVLALVPVENERQAGYDRDLFGYPHDADGDGCDTRAEVLIRDSLTPAQVDRFGCGIVAGDWYSAYDDTTWSDPGEVQIDHVVAMKEAWDSGAWSWPRARQVAFGNDLLDPRTLRVTTGDLNSAKGDKDPSNWLPPNPTAVCPFLADWVAIKARWSMSMDQSEHGRIRNVLTQRCPDQLIAPWPTTAPPPTTTAPTTSVAFLPIVSLPPGTSPPATPPKGNCHPSYPTVCIPPPPPDLDCGDVPYRRFEVVGSDPHRFDGDDDGIGCES